MTSNNKLQIAYGLMIVLLLTGIFCYAGTSDNTPDEPYRIMFKNTAGKVLLDHAGHISDYSEDCSDCHHNLEDDESYTCSDCHEAESDDEEMPSIMDSMHSQCIGCHEEMSGPVDCEKCHML